MLRFPTISAPELAACLHETVVIDASWIYPPFNSAGIHVRHSYCERHIPGSWFLDLASLSQAAPSTDPRVPALRRPPRTLVQRLLGEAARSMEAPIVVTDMDGGCTSAPFARWLLKEAGYRNVRLLDGGTPSWRLEQGFAVTHVEPRIIELSNPPSAIESSPAEASPWFATFEDVLRAIEDAPAGQLLDCRALATNRGVLPDDYGGVEIPCPHVARSTEVVEETAYGLRFKRPAELATLFAARAIDAERPAITTCYFGVGAAVVATALELAEYALPRVYAGSVVEYARRMGQRQ